MCGGENSSENAEEQGNKRERPSEQPLKKKEIEQ